MRLALAAIASCLAALVSSRPAHASGDEAWRAFDARVTRACVVASGIRDHRASRIVGFDDRVGMVAMLVSDRSRGSAMSKLCLYDKRAGRAFVGDAETWSAPPQRR